MIPDTIEKIYRDQYLLFINTTPNATNPTWVPVGIGVTDLSINYNAQVDTEKWILERNSRSDHTSNQKQTAVSQKAYINDPCFEFIEKGEQMMLPKDYEWYGAFGLLVTLVWLYLEILKLLSKINRK